MRSTNQIVIAVQEQHFVTEEELRLALLAEASIGSTYWRTLGDLIRRIREDPGASRGLKFTAELKWMTLESLFLALKEPPDKFLGPDYTPGTPENKRLRKIAKNIAKKAGLDLESEQQISGNVDRRKS